MYKNTNVRLHNVSIHINFNHNWLINECARKKKATIIEPKNHEVFSEIYKNLRS